MKNVVGIFLGIGGIADGRFVPPVGGFPKGLDIAKRCRRNEAAEGLTPKNDQREERSTWPARSCHLPNRQNNTPIQRYDISFVRRCHGGSLDEVSSIKIK